MLNISHFVLTFLVNAVWQVPVVTAVAWLVCRVMRRGPGAHRHAVWVAALAASLLLPIASLRPVSDNAALRSAVPSAEHALASRVAGGGSDLATEGAATAPSGRRIVSYAPAVGAMLFGGYCFFLLIQGWLLFWRWLRTQRIRDDAGPLALSGPLEQVWLRCIETFGLYDVELLQSRAVESPVAAGFWRKTIILPQSLAEETSEDVLVTAIGHEMAHLARHDFALKLLYELAALPLSFHPAALFIRRAIEQTREMACDEKVTRALLDPDRYARSILTIAAAMTAVPRPGYTLGVFDGDILEQRIRRLLQRPAANLRRARLLLATGLGALGLCGVIASGLAISARAQGGAAQAEIKLGAEAANRGDADTAVEHFQNAVRQEPENIRAKLFLANALIRQSNAEGQDSAPLAAARQQYLDVLARDPKNRQALQGMAALALNSKQFAEAHDWLQKALAQDPHDEAALYTTGFVDWATIYPPYMRARAGAGMPPEQQGIIPDAAARRAFVNEYGTLLDEGFHVLQTALSIKPDDADAMAYINLLYRIKAAVVDTDAESQDAKAQADQWVERALATKRMHAQDLKPTVALDLENAPGPWTGIGNAPPPPPPPPPPPSNQPASPAALGHPNAREVGGLFWQVVKGNAFANALTQSLKAQGFPVRIVAGPDRLVRVMVGPYADQGALDQAKSALEAAGVEIVRQW